MPIITYLSLTRELLSGIYVDGGVEFEHALTDATAAKLYRLIPYYQASTQLKEDLCKAGLL